MTGIDAPVSAEVTDEENERLAEFIWKLDNVELTTVGIDIGSSTSHLMFARVHLQRNPDQLSSAFVVVGRKILWRSPILLTPFLADNTIDAERLRSFIDGAYREAGLSTAAIDSGAVILTGEAIKRVNAPVIADLFAADAGKFVCASAGHHLECMLAANGSGAVEFSRRESRVVLHVDIGGGTTKLALIKNGDTLGTCAIAVGGRLMVRDEEGRLTRIDESAHLIAASLGFTLHLGQRPDPADFDCVIAALSNGVIELIRQVDVTGQSLELFVTAPLIKAATADMITFSGGVSEYIYGRESQMFGDIAKPLADHIVRAFQDGRITKPIADPGQGIRATVIGASQFSVQLSGKTIHIGRQSILPVHNIPVLSPVITMGPDMSEDSVAAEVCAALERTPVEAGQPIALAVHWRGDPHYRRLRALAGGILRAQGMQSGSPAPLILVSEGDIGKTMGRIFENELGISGIISIDGVQLRDFDYVDIGDPIEPNFLVPVVIKSLLFSGGQQHLAVSPSRCREPQRKNWAQHQSTRQEQHDDQRESR